MAKKTDIEMAKSLAVKRIKAQVRLELACRADLILNELMDEFDKAFAKALAEGGSIELTGYQDFVRDRVDKRLPLALVRGQQVEQVMSELKFGGLRQRTLDFDIEARPLSWLGGDFVTREVTAIGARFLDSRKVYVWALGESTSEEMLLGFKELYDEADIVTGHYIRGYDLPGVNDALMEFNLPGLSAKWSVDTKGDLRKGQGVSKSQESLGAMLGIRSPKIQMSQKDWRGANRLSPEGIEKTKRRVVGDVNQHVEMLGELRARGLVSDGRLWTPGPAGTTKYTP